MAKREFNRPAGLIEKMHIGNGIIIRLRLGGLEKEESILQRKVARGEAKGKLFESTAINKKAAC